MSRTLAIIVLIGGVSVLVAGFVSLGRSFDQPTKALAAEPLRNGIVMVFVGTTISVLGVNRMMIRKPPKH